MALAFWIKQEKQHKEALEQITKEIADCPMIITEVKLRNKIAYHENERKNCLYQIRELS